MARISVVRPGTNRILCEARGFVYIRFEVLENGYQLTNQTPRLSQFFNCSNNTNLNSAC
jgi:hypothetical protein